MNIKALLKDDNAVSPVIGVILMVAITVILAAVIGTFVLNLGGNLSETSPQASFGFDFNENSVVITHESGESVPASQLKTTGFEATNPGSDWANSSLETVSAGDSITLNSSGWEGQTVRVVWSSENEESSSTLSQTTAPDNSA